ncbi:MAG: hypothetical protein Ct9H300mP31_00230 [Acidimicrobiaceae bacterium]|nr:MAG: hypothetical protein Ct9H300mP31_00230 [Acidimicrobiaceae bacterium]
MNRFRTRSPSNGPPHASRRNKSRDGARRGKKKVSPLTIAKVDFVDYKDTDMLRKFVSERSKLKTRQNTGKTRSSSVRWPGRSKTPGKWP